MKKTYSPKLIGAFKGIPERFLEGGPMTDYNPDSLRALKREISAVCCWTDTPAKVDAHADAWEAQLGAWEQERNVSDTLAADNAALRERAQDLIDSLGREAFTTLEGHNACDLYDFLELRSALAGEVKP